MPSVADVVDWMVLQINDGGILYQEHAATGIYDGFGEPFVYYNNNGNLALSKPVLQEFNKRTARNVVWMRSDKLWRRREPGDEPGRQQP